MSKQIVRRYLDEIVSRGDISLGAELIADDVVFVSPYTPEPITRREALEAMLAGIHAAFPDFYLREEAMLAEGDLVASRWVAGGTHTGAPFNGAPPSGRQFEITGMSIYRVRDGRIVEGWVNDDTFLMRAQLGFIAEPPAVG
ncbi:MAG TPA: ester cyclase [Candidatus Binatia bacterium]|nr:ester cyclase [Candidatus Binatia bacterium]